MTEQARTTNPWTENADQRIGRAIRQWREGLGVSVAEATRRAGIDEADWQIYEAGRARPVPAVLFAIARAIDATVGELCAQADTGSNC